MKPAGSLKWFFWMMLMMLAVWVPSVSWAQKEVLKEQAGAPSEPAVAAPVLRGERLAQAQEDQEKFKEAWATWKEVIKIENDAGTLTRYAAFLKRIGEVNEAVKVMEGVIASQPLTNPSLLYWVADAYAESGRINEASARLKEIGKRFPDEAAEVERRLGRMEPAPGQSTPAGSEPRQPLGEQEENG